LNISCDFVSGTFLKNYSAIFSSPTPCSYWTFHSHWARHCWRKLVQHPWRSASVHQQKMWPFAFPLSVIQEKLSLTGARENFFLFS